jgi:hypothetical protein
MLGIGRGESYVIKQSGLWIQRDHTLDLESVLLADGVKGRVLINVSFRSLCSIEDNYRPKPDFSSLAEIVHMAHIWLYAILCHKSSVFSSEK